MKAIARIFAPAALAAGIFALVHAMPARVAAQPAAAKPAATKPDSTKPKPVPANVRRGEKVFVEYCAMCHGDRGNGDGDIGVGLKSKANVSPANLTDRARLEALGLRGVQRVITLGGGHTGRSNMMPAWGEMLTAGQISDVAHYVMSLPDQNPGISSYTLRAYANTPQGTPEKGHSLFLHHCAVCHGTQGKGDGVLAARLKEKNHISPRNLTDSLYISKKTDKDLFLTITLGGGHMGKSTAMPVWGGYLTPEQIKDLVSFIRAISRTASQP